ncbi:glycoside hydrolase family 13 protein [Lawsonibacter sp.]|uniref:glycoside hydrolase family 13 protein n=1 Tax=Lawsonibacter sp. TaxID=2185275 RepID=UPI00258EC6DD|nr:glycoside hydrolase family 13 protein [Lawsonibacter sp.]MBS1384345.1 glycoside hydrolase family 13 protein [Flavonifractor sp.]MCI6399679.1 glycoside hydrolase family 13 protein [Lawsonibacter sp.]MDU2195057.1 glycoside hydrolase family 13 protein [Clostridiales bacterium]MDY2976104.1 glycoside hydrolase family 13 protein [Oscillospiraceae bacterium]
MTDTLLFDPRDERYKSPYGAVSAGTVVHFALRPERAQAFSRAVLTARFESRANELVRIFLPWSGRDGERDVFAGSLPTGDYVGLIFYSFRLEGLDGRTRTLGEYQLTVYDGCEQVPAWFGEGTCYQIFPDRFRRSRIPDPGGMVGGRSVHAAWQEEPEYRPDARGEVRNRDFFGGDLKGVLEQLPYLQSLGVETLYFNPIFEAAENHRYGTADYEHVDPMLGCDADFSALCQAAHARGMRVILDGVFNHTGFVSRYFNGDGFYPQPGAAQSRQSPYYPWFHFQHWPDRFDSWWGIYTLPAVNEGEDSYRDYIIRGEHSIVRRWLQAGADGWRLDVADELPDDFIRELHQAVRAADPNAVVIGEVWEDGSTKIAYGVRRRHILGGHCDGLMNYPFRNGLISFLLGADAACFRDAMETLRENYPPFAFASAMNFLGTHDTPRILTLLGVGSDCRENTKAWRANFRMDAGQRALALARLRLGALVLFAFPGAPTIYYGDEAGMEGFEDPFNRRTFPWGAEDKALTAWYAALGQARKSLLPLRRGDLRWLRAEGRVLAFSRTWEGETVIAAVNAGDAPEQLPLDGAFRDRMSGERFTDTVPLPPLTGRLLTGERCKSASGVV